MVVGILTVYLKYKFYWFDNDYLLKKSNQYIARSLSCDGLQKADNIVILLANSFLNKSVTSYIRIGFSKTEFSKKILN